MFHHSAGVLDLSNARVIVYFATSFYKEKVTSDFLINQKQKFCSVTMKCQQSMLAFVLEENKKIRVSWNEGDYMPVSLKPVQ